MKTIFKTEQQIVDICTKSSYLQREGKLNYFYVYIHYINNKPIYVGQGSHNRAYKYKGRSEKWYNKFNNSIKVEIVKSELYFRESLNLEKEYIEKYSSTIINKSYGHSPNEAFKVLCFTKKGKLVKEYIDSNETYLDGFSPGTVRATCCYNNRHTYKNYVWCYTKNYEKLKDTLFKFGKTVRKAVEVTFPDGAVKTYSCLRDTRQDGLLPDKVGAVLRGERKKHKGCSFKYL